MSRWQWSLRSRGGRAARVGVAAVVAAVAAQTIWVSTGGRRPVEVATTSTGRPADLPAYARGDLGVVSATFPRRYLVQAYRVLNGRPALANIVPADESRDDREPSPPSPVPRWIELRDRVLAGTGPAADLKRYIATHRHVEERYFYFDNCQDDAFVNAVRTLELRMQQFGVTSSEVRDWTRAQHDVFANCSGKELVLPGAPASKHQTVVSDFAYQTAAAHFYAMKYDEAARLFKAIAADGRSPWQPYGRYLAARATIRSATLLMDAGPERDAVLERAAAELRGVIADPQAVVVHASARGLIDFIDVRLHRLQRVQVLASRLATADNVSDQELTDYRDAMNRWLGDSFSYDALPERDRLAATHELNDWMLVVQSGSHEGVDHGLARWRESRSPAWLLAVLLAIDAAHPAVNDVLDASAAFGRKSPVYATAMLRKASLLLDLERRDEARQLLAQLPLQPEAGFGAEAVNVASAARFRAAVTIDELLQFAPRTSLDSQFPGAVFDRDAGDAFTLHLPVTRLVEAATKTTLPDRLRRRVAGAAFTRAFLLDHEDAARQAARALRTIVPRLQTDLDGYLNAADDEAAHRAGMLLMLRTPGLKAYVRGSDNERTFAQDEPLSGFNHMFRDNWWCAAQVGAEGARLKNGPGDWTLREEQRVVTPAIGEADRATARHELRALVAIGSPQGYLAEEAVKWAQAAPTDLRAAEALALAVEGGRWSCAVRESSRRAFQTLHRLFPKSEWARRTKYWYEPYY